MLKKISNYLQSSPILITLMFIIGCISGLFTIFLGWNDFYNDFLSKSITLPIWLFLIIGLILAVFYIFLNKTLKSKSGKLTTVTGEKFGIQQVKLDGNSYQRCDFSGTELIFSGEDKFEIVECKFSNQVLTFAGNAAATINVLVALHKDPVFKDTVNKTLDEIKSDNIKVSVPVNKRHHS